MLYYILINNPDEGLHVSDEGPFESVVDAVQFAQCEIGMEWCVVLVIASSDAFRR